LTYNVIGIIVAVAVNAALSLMPAKLAKDKGCSFFAYWFLGIFLTFITCYMVVESLEDKRAPLGNWKPANGYSKPVHPGNKDIPGLALTGIFLLGALILCMTDSRFFSAENLRNVADVQFGFYAAAALAVALTMKAGGPDISFVPISVLAGYIAASGDPLWGLVSALGVCVLIGIVNGLIVTLTNMPSAFFAARFRHVIENDRRRGCFKRISAAGNSGRGLRSACIFHKAAAPKRQAFEQRLRVT